MPTHEDAVTSLPPPQGDALDASNRLHHLIAEQIAQQGPMPAEAFWQLALYHPTLGYYHNGLSKFGADGDFVTAPELGEGFAFCLAQWAVPVLDTLGTATILELGAGSGALAVGLLRALEQRGCLPEEYWILEVSGALKQRQRETLEASVPHLLPRVRWLDQAPQASWQGILLGNEVVDALPPRRLIFDQHQWRELRVGLAPAEEAGLAWQAGDPVEIDLPNAIEIPGYTTEDQPMLEPWVGELSRNLSRGAVLLVDYGYVQTEYYHPQRGAGTAIAHYRHRAHNDLLWMPGLQDLSVSVNFTALAQALTAAQMTVDGYTSQAQFLLQYGLTDYASQIDMDGSPESMKVIQEMKYLTLPAEMGERFQVMLASRDLSLPPLAVSHLHRL